MTRCKRCAAPVVVWPVGKPYCPECLAYWRAIEGETPKVIPFRFAKSLDRWPRGAA